MKALRYVAVIWMALCGNEALAAELCSHIELPFEPDMTITESDLSAESAAEALRFVRQERARVGGDLTFGVLNATKVMIGYALKRRAELTGADVDANRFCDWLTSEGFWYD